MLMASLIKLLPENGLKIIIKKKGLVRTESFSPIVKLN